MTGPFSKDSIQFQPILRNNLEINGNLLKKSCENYTDACITSMKMLTPKEVQVQYVLKPIRTLVCVRQVW